MSEEAISYKVFIRVPFARGSFVDPPDSKWDAIKDRELWRTLSSTSKGKELDWHGLADRFEVTLPFLLQQAAWLYDRQLSQVREQLRRVKPSTGSATASPTPPSDSASASAVGAQPMRRIGSAASAARQSSNLTLKPRTSLDGTRDGSATASPVAERPQRAPYSRQTSATTVTQVRPAFTSETVQDANEHQTSRPTNASVIRRTRAPSSPTDVSPKASPSPPASSSSSSSEDDDGPVLGQSRAFARRPQFSRILSKGKSKAARLSSVADDEDDEADSESDDEYLPFAKAAPRQKAHDSPGDKKQKVNPNLHIRTGTTTQSSRPSFPEPKTPRANNPSGNATAVSSSSPSATSSSLPESASASASQPSMPPTDRSHRSPLNALSPKQRRSIAKDGSDTGTPSMGSSFSDLDDASVNTSAMEEAMANQMRAGATGAAASALRSSLAMGGRFGGLWRGGQGGQG